MSKLASGLLSFAILTQLSLMAFAGPDGPALAEDQDDSHLTAAQLEQYRIASKDDEIALARSAAPASISADADIFVLGRKGFELASKGSNSFVCVVERSWIALFDSKEFWNPKIRAPICFNPAAARSVFPITLKRAQMVLAGRSKREIMDDLKSALKRGELPSLEPGAMSYMMSKSAYLTDAGDHNLAHLMFYTPLTKASEWGAGSSKSPVMLGPQFNGHPEPITVFLVSAGNWSDGTPAPAD